MNQDLEINKCEFCREELTPKEITFRVGAETRNIRTGYERCNCKDSVYYWKKYDEEQLKQEELQKQQEHLEKVEKLLANSKMGTRLRKYTFDNFELNNNNIQAHAKAKSYAEEFIDNKRDTSFVITGGCGTGKTHLACSIANYLIQNEIAVVYGTLISLLGNIRNSYESDVETEQSYINRYSTVPLLIIDDLGKEKPTEWGLEKLFTIINNRYENELPVVITTNFDRVKLREKLCYKNNYETVDAII